MLVWDQESIFVTAPVYITQMKYVKGKLLEGKIFLMGRDLHKLSETLPGRQIFAYSHSICFTPPIGKKSLIEGNVSKCQG